jgi:hypothetical protein
MTNKKVPTQTDWKPTFVIALADFHAATAEKPLDYRAQPPRATTGQGGPKPSPFPLNARIRIWPAEMTAEQLAAKKAIKARTKARRSASKASKAKDK